MTSLPTRPKAKRKRATRLEVLAAMARIKKGEPIATVAQETGIAQSALKRRAKGKLKAHRERARLRALHPTARPVGRPPAVLPFCTNCGTKAAPGWRYCGGCGTARGNR